MSSACPHYGFQFSFRAATEVASDDTEALWVAFIKAIEEQGLSAGGGVTGTQWNHVISRDGAQATQQDREWLLAWARNRVDVIDAVAGPLIDLNDEGS